MKTNKIKWLLTFIASATIIIGCGSNDESSKTKTEPMDIYTTKEPKKANPFGVGPIKDEVVLSKINPELAKEGEAIFTQMCTACHKMDKRHVGPPLNGVIERRNPTWVMNMILDPEQMVKEDPVAKALLAEYLSPMANQNLTEDQARAVLEYFRQYDQQTP
ncbi:MAG: cytochrome c [Salibacteraceae bacterium]